VKIILLVLLAFFFSGFYHLPRTKKFAGRYSYGKDPENGRAGFIDIYPETDSSILFYLDLNRGAPSYNMGQLYGRAKLIGNSGVFFMKNGKNNCRFRLTFSRGVVVLKTVDDSFDCPFGGGVFVDGNYKQFSKKAPKYFIGPTGEDTIYFRKTPPEKYNE